MTGPDLDFPFDFPFDDARRLVRTALEEDLGPRHRDVTTLATIPADQVRSADVVARAPGVVAGLPVVPLVFDEVATLVGTGPVDTGLLVADGAEVDRGQILARVQGPLRTVLIAERTLLNVVCRLSGVATHTRRWADLLEGTGAMVLDTRKTTPGMRALEKYATSTGGAVNHRAGLYDAILVKDTHLALAGGISGALRAVRKVSPEFDVNVEVSNIQELEQALNDRAPRIMLDNFAPGQVREAMKIIRGRAKVEVSGGVQIATARAYALAGSDYISVGAITHSAMALDFTMKVTRY